MQAAKPEPGTKINVIEKDKGAYLLPFEEPEYEFFLENDNPSRKVSKTYL